MSGSQKSSRSSQQHNSRQTQPLADPAPAAQKLRQTAQDLLHLGTTRETDPLEDADEPESISCPIEEGYARGEFHEEIRCFRLPRHIVDREYALLREHKLEQFSDLVNLVYEKLSGIALLMRHIDIEADLSGYEVYLVSQTLSGPLALLDTICSQLADFELVQKTTVPA